MPRDTVTLEQGGQGALWPGPRNLKNETGSFQESTGGTEANVTVARMAQSGDSSTYDLGSVEVLPKVRSRSARKQRYMYLSQTVFHGFLCRVEAGVRPVTHSPRCRLWGSAQESVVKINEC